VSGLFSTPSAPKPDPELVAAQKRQEEALAAEDRKKRLQIAARMNARKIGGQRMLLSKTREDAEQGIQETLGV
jgi:CRISPR/Cas system-associated endonuclease Cas1